MPQKESLHFSVEQKSVKQSKHKQIPSSNLDIKVILFPAVLVVIFLFIFFTAALVSQKIEYALPRTSKARMLLQH